MLQLEQWQVLYLFLFKGQEIPIVIEKQPSGEDR